MMTSPAANQQPSFTEDESSIFYLFSFCWAQRDCQRGNRKKSSSWMEREGGLGRYWDSVRFAVLGLSPLSSLHRAVSLSSLLWLSISARYPNTALSCRANHLSVRTVDTACTVCSTVCSTVGEKKERTSFFRLSCFCTRYMFHGHHTQAVAHLYNCPKRTRRRTGLLSIRDKCLTVSIATHVIYRLAVHMAEAR